MRSVAGFDISAPGSNISWIQAPSSERCPVYSSPFWLLGMDLLYNEHDSLSKDNYRMMISNFEKLVLRISINVPDGYDASRVSAVWLDWVTSGDSVRRQESRLMSLGIGFIHKYRYGQYQRFFNIFSERWACSLLGARAIVATFASLWRENFSKNVVTICIMTSL